MGKLRFVSDKKPLLRIVALASASSGLLYYASSSNANSETSVSASFHGMLSEALLNSWRHLQEQIPTSVFLCHQNGFNRRNIPLSFSSFISESSSAAKKEDVRCPGNSLGPAYQQSETKKDVSGGGGDGPGHSCNCFGRDTLANAASRAGPAVVNLSVTQGFQGMPLGKSIGSGTIIDSDGTILTCAHVVIGSKGMRALSRGKIGVTLQDGRTYEGTVVNVDLHSDIAIVKINSKTPLPTAKLGSSSKIRPGDWVVALGCPLTLQNTVTAGIVSCVDRKSSDLGLGGVRREYLQTDCAINEGNSGGPLVNVDGEIVGVNNMKILGADGLNFAVPVDAVRKIIEHFKDKGRVVRPWLGLKMIDLNTMIVAQLKERDAAVPSVTKGVLVPMVTPGSPADRAGFLPGDVVIEFDGKSVASIKEIIDIMEDKVGQPLRVVVMRKHDEVSTLTVIPEEANPDL